MPLFTAGGLAWSWSYKQRSWSWSCYFGLGLKNLVLFTSLVHTGTAVTVQNGKRQGCRA